MQPQSRTARLRNVACRGDRRAVVLRMVARHSFTACPRSFVGAHAFSLIHLIGVLSLIAILTTIGLPILKGNGARANRQQGLQTIAESLGSRGPVGRSGTVVDMSSALGAGVYLGDSAHQIVSNENARARQSDAALSALGGSALMRRSAQASKP